MGLMEGGKVISLDPETRAGLHPKVPLGRLLMRQRWDDVSFLHWDVDPEAAQSLLPPGLDIDTFDGRAWVGLVPFQMRGISPAGLPAVPYFGTFPETNVRTYVRTNEGLRGVWFSSLESSRLIPVAVARAVYALPYFHASMHIERHGRTVRYSSLRRWPGPRGVGGTVTIQVGDPIDSRGPLEEFFTSRWRLFTYRRERLLKAEVRHEPWPLHEASAPSYDTSLLNAAGYEDTPGPPHVLYSPRVHVEAYAPTPVEAGSRAMR